MHFSENTQKANRLPGRPIPGPLRKAFLAALIALGLATPAGAVLDIEDRGPCVSVEQFQLRVTNCGIIGNAFYGIGRSTDPSFELPPGSGTEGLNYATLWVGGRLDDGTVHVSGGSLLEFRPTPDPEDRVRLAGATRSGAMRFWDDDNDGEADEERLNGLDDDGDGEVDEDLGLFSQATAAATFVDDRPEAVNFVYPGGELHRPLGVTVDQDVYAWSVPGYDRAVGLRWVITNHTTQPVHDLYVGIYADLDSKKRDDSSGHLDDRAMRFTYRRQVFRTGSLPTSGGCPTTLSQTVYGVADRDTVSGRLPFVTLLPLSHTTDALANFDSLFLEPIGRAPRAVGFRSMIFEVNGGPGSGGLPVTDEQRYEALKGEYREADPTSVGDYAVLISCGPFPRLEAGQTIELNAALLAATARDTLQAQMGNVAVLEQGIKFNRLPDSGGGIYTPHYGETGVAGHESCLLAPPGFTLFIDPHCMKKFEEPALDGTPILYSTTGPCIWTDSDCDLCTGAGGWDTYYRWLDPGMLPPPPRFRQIAGDRRVRIEWNNFPELLVNTDRFGWQESRFLGYRVWKVSDWHDRLSLMPDLDKWSLALNAGSDLETGALPLSAYTDSTVDFERILYEQKLYPVGRYAWEDTDVRDGFDYVYFVGAVYELRMREPSGYLRVDRVTSPIQAVFDERVTPRAEAQAAMGGVHVVPNPYRGRVPWDRRPVFGDAPTSHLDFVGLPRAMSRIRVWTLAGDLVADLSHDGRSGNGQAPWNLVSRSGQDIASGVYVFTVDSSLGQQTGRFVVIR